MATRRLQLVLDLDTGAYSGRLSAAGSQLKIFSGTVERANRSLGSMGKSFDTLGSHMSTPLSKLRDYVLILGNVHFALLNLQTIAIGWVGSLLKQSMEVERLTMLMRGLSTASTEVGKNKEAQKNLRDLYDLSRKTGFEVKALADAFVKMKSGGIDPTNGSLKSLANAVAQFGGTSETFHRASIAIQQMSGKGVVSMEELRQQLGEAVPSAIKDMADAMGKSLPDLIDEISKGKVRAGPALTAMFQEFERKYAGAGARMAATLNGQLNAFKTNVTEMATVFTGLDNGNKDGLFAGAKKSLEELNAAMRLPEARQAIAEFGQIVNSVFMGFVSGVKFVIEWRDQIGAAFKAILLGFAIVKGAAIIGWFSQVLVAGRKSFLPLTDLIGKTGTQAKATAGALQSLSDRMVAQDSLWGKAVNKATLWEREQKLANLQVERQITNSFRSTNAANAEVAAMNNKIAAARREKQALDAAASASVNQARATFAATQAATTNGRVVSAVTGQYITQKQAIAENAKAHTTASAVKRRAEAATRLLAMREAALQVAIDNQTAATGRASTALALKTTRLRFMTTASTVAAAAVRGLGIVVNALLGPFGAVLLILWQVADQLGVFTNKADEATAAAARLAQGIASLEDIKSVADQNERLRKDKAALKGDGKGAGFWRTFVGAIGGAAGMPTVIKDNSDAIKKIDEKIAANNRTLNLGKYAMSVDNGRVNTRRVITAAERLDSANSGKYEQARQKLEEKHGRDSPVYRAELAKLQDSQKGNLTGAQVIQSYRAKLEKALTTAKTNNERAAIKAALDETADSANNLSMATDQVGASMDKAGKKTGGAASAADKAGKAFESARDKYQGMIGNNAGELAEVEAEIDSLKSGMDDIYPSLSKFEAKFANGLYADATMQELAKLREQFANLDKATRELEFERGVKRLTEALEDSRVEADALWKSLMGGTWEADQRLAQVSSQFGAELKEARRLDAIERAAAEKKAEAGGEIVASGNKIGPREQGVVDKINNLSLEQIRSDAAEAVREWELATSEIEAGLISQDEAARVRHENEIRNAWDRISMAKLEGAEKQRAEEAFFRWKRAKEAEMARETESVTVKMIRGWSELGQGLQNLMAQSINGLVEGLSDAEFNIAKFAVNIIKQLLKMILTAMIAYAILSALGMANNASGEPVSFGDYMKGQIGQGLGGSADPSRQIGFKGGTGGSAAPNTTGGMSIGATGKPMPTTIRHKGGWLGGRELKQGEVPFVGLKDELILTKDQQNAISSSRGGPNVTMNIINNSGQDVDAESSQPRFDGKAFVIDVVLEAASKPGPLRDTLRMQQGKQ